MRRLLAALGAVLLWGSAALAVAQTGPKVTRAPKLIHFVEAPFPPGEKGPAEVLLSIDIDEDGSVGEVSVLRTAGRAFDAAAVEATKQFRFEPAEIDGVPAPVRITYRYAFTIKEELVPVGPQINFDGVVLERFKKKPLEGVSVAIKDLGLAATTNADGAFAFTDLPLGAHTVELSAPKLITVKTEETLEKGKRKTVKYLVEEKDPGVDEEVVVRAARIKKETVETRIRTEEARQVPGTQGDTLKVVQNLPGVGRSSFGTGQLLVWGSGPNDTLVMFDGVEIPSLYHFGGLRSTVNDAMVHSIDFTPGSYGAEYGLGLGGLVRIESQSLPEEGVHGYVDVNVIDASGMVSATPTKGFHLGVAGRTSYLTETLPFFAGLVGVDTTNIGDFVTIPDYSDYQVEASLDLRRNESITLFYLGSNDHLSRSVYSPDPSEVRTQVANAYFNRLIARYTRILDDGSSFSVTPWIGGDRDSEVSAFGGVPVSLDVDSNRLGMRAAYRRKVNPILTMSLGLDAQASHSHVTQVGSITEPPREGDIVVFGQRPGSQVNADDWDVTLVSAAPYVAADMTFGTLSVSAGLRLEPLIIDGNHLLPQTGSTPPTGYSRLYTALEPRLAVTQRLGRLTLTLGAGLYSQPPQPRDFSAVFGNPTLGLLREVDFNVGAAYKFTGTLTLETVFFYKYLWDQVSRNESQNPPLATALTQDGVGRVYGAQLLLRQQIFRGFFGWLNYSLIKSERRDHPGEAYYLFDFDQTNVLGILASYDLGRGWQVGGRFRYVTGFPRTPVEGSYYDAHNDVYQPLFGAHNTIRVPDFHAFDVRVDKFIVLGATKLDIYLDVQNVTNQLNAEDINYNYNFTRHNYITGLPILPVLGARLEF